MTRSNFALGGLAVLLALSWTVLSLVILSQDKDAGAQAPPVTHTPNPVPTSVSGMLPTSANATGMAVFSPTSIWNQRIPAHATYTIETRIGSFRPMAEDWAAPIYRIAPGQTYPLVQVENYFSGRIEIWPIPTFALPSTTSDHNMVVLYPDVSYEFWDAHWVDATHISAGGMVAFWLDGAGISDPPNQRVSASGFSILAGVVVREDFTTDAGQLDPNAVIDHPLTMALPGAVISADYIPPAVGGEVSGQAGTSGIPMGALFALPPDLDVDSLDVLPYTKALLRAARDYGVYACDANGTPLIDGKAVGTLRIEPGLYQAVYGLPGRAVADQIQREVAAVIAQYGLYLVTVD